MVLKKNMKLKLYNQGFKCAEFSKPWFEKGYQTFTFDSTYYLST